jgi:hypothetical protein
MPREVIVYGFLPPVTKTCKVSQVETWFLSSVALIGENGTEG